MWQSPLKGAQGRGAGAPFRGLCHMALPFRAGSPDRDGISPHAGSKPASLNDHWFTTIDRRGFAFRFVSFRPDPTFSPLSQSPPPFLRHMKEIDTTPPPALPFHPLWLEDLRR